MTNQIFNKISFFLVSALCFTLPLFFLPLTADFYNLNKIALIYLAAAFLLIVWAAKIFKERKISWRSNLFGWPILSLSLVFLISSLVQAPNKISALINPSGLIICLGLISFFISQKLKEKDLDWILTSFIVSSIVLAWITIFSYLGLIDKIGIAWMKGKAWTPAGSALNNLSFLLALLPATLFWAFKTSKPTEKILLFLAGSLQTLAVILVGSYFFNKTVSLPILPIKYGWQICVEGFKNLRIAFLGVGPNNFLSAFNHFRPLGLNKTKYWTMKFFNNSNEFFQLLSTVGLLGLGSYLWLISKAKQKITLFSSAKQLNNQNLLIKQAFYLILITSFILQLLIASNILIWLLIFVSLGALAIDEKQNQQSISLKPLNIGFGFFLLLFSGTLFYVQARVWLADRYLNQSLKARKDNKGIATYNLQIKALKFNPINENYHLIYSDTNFSLANSLASQKDLTDQDKQNVSQLISQSIREAKQAVNLNPQISGSWLNLAILYRNIINSAKGADQWTISAFNQAIITDPTNPLLRVNFGGLFYALKNYDQAMEQFKIAINLKPDYANAYYNLAAVYKEQKNWQKAYDNTQMALNLVPADNPDKDKVAQELAELKAKLPKPPVKKAPSKPAQKENQLKAPQPIPTPKPGFSNITLPEESGPEVPGENTTGESNTPSSSPSQEATPSATE